MSYLLPAYKLGSSLCHDVLSIKLEINWKLLVFVFLSTRNHTTYKSLKDKFCYVLCPLFTKKSFLISFPLIIGPLAPSVTKQANL